MTTLVAVSTVLAATLGAVLGYDTAGIGGAILHGALIGIGGALAGALIARTAVLLRHVWRAALVTLGLALLAALTWGVYF